MEVIIGNFAMEVFGPRHRVRRGDALITHGVVGGSIYEVPELSLVSMWEFIPYVALGIACALVGRAFMAVLFGASRIFGKLPLPQWGRMLLGGLGVGAVAIWVPQVLGNGYDGVNQALTGTMTFELMAWALAGKLLATAFSIGSGTPGGVFTPTIFLGAMLGGMVGKIAHALAGHTGRPRGLCARQDERPPGGHDPHPAHVHADGLRDVAQLPADPAGADLTGVSLISRAMKRESIYTEG
jgi:CIC family chloride channel protein